MSNSKFLRAFSRKETISRSVSTNKCTSGRLTNLICGESMRFSFPPVSWKLLGDKRYTASGIGPVGYVVVYRTMIHPKARRDRSMKKALAQIAMWTAILIAAVIIGYAMYDHVHHW